MYEKIVVITRKTRLQELVERFNTRAQAKFYIEHNGGQFSDYEAEHEAYQRSVESAHRLLDVGLKVQFIDRQFLPTFVFSTKDLVVAIGQDGLVANAAKYVGEQPLIGINPDAARYDGILVPFKTPELPRCLERVLHGSALIRSVTMAEARLNDGQKLLAFNDLFIGARTHVSARYELSFGGATESQSSSGLIVSTGAGSTGWMSSVFNMVSSVSRFLGSAVEDAPRLDWETASLMFIVREPFISKHSSASLVAGLIDSENILQIESRMPFEGTIFSDGVENDFLAFNSGSIVTVGLSDTRAHLVVPELAKTAASRPVGKITESSHPRR
jgi:NAD kinase